MSAQVMYHALNARAPTAHKEKHHGNIRRCLARMKVKARRAERAATKHKLFAEQD